MHNFMIFLKSSSACNKPVNGKLCDTLHSRYQGVLYFLNIQFHDSRINAILLTSVCNITFHAPIFAKITNAQHRYVQITHMEFYPNRTININKGKSVPLQAWSGPEGSRKLRFPDFMTTAQEGGKVISHTHRSHLPPGNPPGTHFC
jgi:hypothetical protein